MEAGVAEGSASLSESEEGRRASPGGEGGGGPSRGPRRSGGRQRQAGRALKRGRGGPRWAGGRRAAGAAEEAGARLPSPGRPYCSALVRLFARRALFEGGVLRPNSPPTPAFPNSNVRVGAPSFIIGLSQRGVPNSRARREEALQRATKLEEAGQACN